MVREIIHVQLGQCGNQIGNSFWNTITKEHNLLPDGKFITNNNEDQARLDKINVFFNETTDEKKFSARSILIDTDPSTLDTIKASSIGSIFKPDNFCFGSFGGGTGNNWAKGHYTDGAEIIDEIIDIIRRETEGCDCPQGFQMSHSIGGGTGSGLGTLTLLKIRDLYPDIITSNYSIFPSIKVSDIVVEPYNATLSIHQLLENSDQTHVLDNEALFNISHNILKQTNPKYSDLNWIIPNVMSDITASLRFSGKLNGDLRKLGVNLIPYPRLHFFLLSQSPLFGPNEKDKINLTVQELTDQMWSSRNFLSNVKSEDGKYNTAACIYRGNIPTLAVDDEIAKIQQKLADDFVTFIPNNIKSSLINIPPCNTPKSGTLIANTTAIKGVFQRISARFAKMFKRKAFLHWYKSEGMDIMEFQEADKNVRDLITEYQDKQDAVVDLECDDDDDEDYDDDEDEDDESIGFAVGGAKDVNNFRKCIEENIIPNNKSAVTYNGLLYEYYFDTKTRKSQYGTATTMENKDDNNDDEKKYENEQDAKNSKLFYPSYCYAKVKKMDFIGNNDKENKTNDDNDFEYYMTVGLNSNLKKSQFKRKNLNIVIVLDRSGSMGWGFTGEKKSKMQVANQAVITLLKHLKPDDRFGFLLFDDKYEIIQKLEMVKNINLKELEQKILKIKENGGTDFALGYRQAIKLFKELDKNQLNDMEYDNRVIYLTDAQPSCGITNPQTLMWMVNEYAIDRKYRIYATFIGIGLDFNTSLINEIGSIRGCNYYSVKSSSDFVIKMDQEFEFMVTPLVFNVCLKINCEGNSCQIDKVYGANDKKSASILENGEIKRIGTLFPSVKSKAKGGTKGGIQLIKLKKSNNNNNDNINVELIVTFETVDGKKYENKQFVNFNPPRLTVINDMIDDGDDDEDGLNDLENFYDNLGIRKGILLCKYVEILHDWIECDDEKRKLYKDYKFKVFQNYFKREMKFCKDEELQKEYDILQKLVTKDFNKQQGYNNRYYDSDEEEEEDF